MESMDGKKVLQIDSLKDLQRELRFIFQEDEVDVEYLQEVMLSYRSNAKDWKKYAFFDRHRYTRNLVDDGNGKYNLMILCWSEGQASSIHDHPSQHCIMKILSGTLTETRFAWPSTGRKSKESSSDSKEGSSLCSSSSSSEDDSNEETEGMKVLSETDLHVNDVAYMSDDLGLHRMENKSHVLPCISLHLYIPPYDACRVFDERTGHATTMRAVFHSERGKKLVFSLTEDMFENN